MIYNAIVSRRSALRQCLFAAFYDFYVLYCIDVGAFWSQSCRTANVAQGVTFRLPKKQPGTLMRAEKLKHGLLVFFTIVTLGLVIGALIPPDQSPDEHDHLKRAYVLSRLGQAYTVPGQSTGGDVDVNFNQYIAIYAQAIAGKPDARNTAALTHAAGELRWSGDRQYTGMPGAAPYLPISYLPQAIGLRIGQWLDLSIAKSYYLARACALIVIGVIIAFAFSVFPPNALAICILALPMSMFQISSPTADGLSFAWLVLAISLFCRGIERDTEFETEFPPLWSALFILATFMVTSSRPQLLPVLALPMLVFARRKMRGWLVVSIASAVVVVGWLYVALHFVDLRMPRSVTTGQAIAIYVKHPWQFVEVFSNTLASPVYRKFYWASFVGVLGWLERPLPEIVYPAAAVALAVALAVSVARGAPREQRVWLALCAIGTVLLTFFAMLVTWTNQPTDVIVGVQGRYFIAPALLVAYALSGSQMTPRRAIMRVAVSGAFITASAAVTVMTLLWKYYL